MAKILLDDKYMIGEILLGAGIEYVAGVAVSAVAAEAEIPALCLAFQVLKDAQKAQTVYNIGKSVITACAPDHSGKTAVAEVAEFVRKPAAYPNRSWKRHLAVKTIGTVVIARDRLAAASGS